LFDIMIGLGALIAIGFIAVATAEVAHIATHAT
jgi:hypothetical protein